MQRIATLLAVAIVAVCAASNTFNKGDITISLDATLAKTLINFINDEDSCPANVTGIQKRTPDAVVACLDAREIYYNVAPSGPLSGLQLAAYDLGNQRGGIHVPVFRDPATQQQLAEIILDAGNIVPTLLLGVSESTTVALALIAFFSLFAVAIEGVGSLTMFVIDSKYFKVGAELSLCPFADNNKIQCGSMLCKGSNGHCTLPHLFSMCSCQPYRCPKNNDDDYLCPDECGGDDGSGKCKGLSDGTWKGCAWADVSVPDQNPPANKGPNPKCNGIGTNQWVSEAVVQKAVNTFCSDPGNLGGYAGARTSHEYDPGTVYDIRLTIDFPQPTFFFLTNQQCQSDFAQIISGCDVDPANPQNFKHGGVYTDAAGPVLTIEPLAGDPVLQCDPPDPPGLPKGYTVAMTRDGMVASINDFCSVNSGKQLSQELYKEYAPDGPPSTMGPSSGLQMIRLHASRPGVQTLECQNWNGILEEPECLRAFMALTDGCDASTALGKRGGSSYFECINFRIEGSGGADWYHMHLRQEMSRETSTLTWTVYNSRAQIVGGPSAGSTATGAPYNVGFWVDSPTDKDATNVRMSYPPVPLNGNNFIGLRYLWSTGWTGQGEGSQDYTKHYYCDDVLNPLSQTYWVPYGAGFARDFDCYFVGWANSDGLAFKDVDHVG